MKVKTESKNVQTSVKHGLKAVCAFIAMINTTAKQTIEFIIVLPTLITDVAHLSKFSQSNHFPSVAHVYYPYVYPNMFIVTSLSLKLL